MRYHFLSFHNAADVERLAVSHWLAMFSPNSAHRLLAEGFPSKPSDVDPKGFTKANKLALSSRRGWAGKQICAQRVEHLESVRVFAERLCQGEWVRADISAQM